MGGQDLGGSAGEVTGGWARASRTLEGARAAGMPLSPSGASWSVGSPLESQRFLKLYYSEEAVASF